MLVARAPLRITLGGGGSDLRPHTGLCVAGAIDKYVTVATSRPLSDGYTLRYSEIERVGTVDEVQHRILREALRVTDTPPGLELSSTADIPSGTGLGSSGAFTVAVLKALLPDASRPEIARLACQIDTGQQDQWASVYGGVNVFDFRARTVRPIDTNIDRYLALYYTGRRRDGSSSGTAPEVVPDRREVDQEVQALERNDPDRLGWCFRRQWTEKLDRDPSDFHLWCLDYVTAVEARGLAYGGKSIGAGGGGFLLFATEEHEDLDELMQYHGLKRVPFRFDHQGVQ